MRGYQSVVSRRAKETERYFWLSFTLALLSNLIAFQGSRLFDRGRFYADLILPADSAIPFLPWTITVYFGCFLFWLILYRIIARLPRQEADRFFCANLLSKAASFVIFVFFPTATARPDVNGITVWDTLIRFLYRIDAPDNTFPSLHCMVAWLCWAGIRGNKRVPLPWRIVAPLMTVAVCLSTLTTRQHVLLDAAGGILLSELCYWLAGSKKILCSYSSFLDRLMSGARQTEEKRVT